MRDARGGMRERRWASCRADAPLRGCPCQALPTTEPSLIRWEPRRPVLVVVATSTPANQHADDPISRTIRMKLKQTATADRQGASLSALPARSVGENRVTYIRVWKVWAGQAEQICVRDLARGRIRARNDAEGWQSSHRGHNACVG